jgi:hypothetical protein
MTSSLVSDVLAMVVRHQQPDAQASIGGIRLRAASATRFEGGVLVAAPRALGRDRLPARQSGAGRLRRCRRAGHGSYRPRRARPVEVSRHRYWWARGVLGNRNRRPPDGLLTNRCWASRLAPRPGPMGHDPVTTRRGGPAPPTIEQTQPLSGRAHSAAPSHAIESVTFVLEGKAVAHPTNKSAFEDGDLSDEPSARAVCPVGMRLVAFGTPVQSKANGKYRRQCGRIGPGRHPGHLPGRELDLHQPV